MLGMQEQFPAHLVLTRVLDALFAYPPYRNRDCLVDSTIFFNKSYNTPSAIRQDDRRACIPLWETVF